MLIHCFLSHESREYSELYMMTWRTNRLVDNIKKSRTSLWGSNEPVVNQMVWLCNLSDNLLLQVTIMTSHEHQIITNLTVFSTTQFRLITKKKIWISTSNQWITFTKSQWCGKCIHVMTSGVVHWDSLGSQCRNGPDSLTVFPSQFKFDGNFVSLSSRF